MTSTIHILTLGLLSLLVGHSVGQERLTNGTACTTGLNCLCEGIPGVDFRVHCRLNSIDVDGLMAQIPMATVFLSLANASLTAFPLRLVKSLPFLKTIDLSDNKITRIPPFVRISPITIRVDRNPLYCDCAVSNLVTWGNNVTGQCAGPSGVASIDVKTAVQFLICTVGCKKSFTMLYPTRLVYEPPVTVNCQHDFICITLYILRTLPLLVPGAPPYPSDTNNTYEYRIQTCVPQPIANTCPSTCRKDVVDYVIPSAGDGHMITCVAKCCHTFLCNKNQAEGCEKNSWKLFDSSCYMTSLYPHTMSHNQASEICRNKSSTLAIITNTIEWYYLKATRLMKDNLIFIGLREELGKWRHPDGSMAKFLPWEGPVLGVTKPCGIMSSINGLFGAVECNDSSAGKQLICEKMAHKLQDPSFEIASRACAYQLSNCSQTCSQVDSIYQCTCFEGYHLTSDGQCVDINECSCSNQTSEDDTASSGGSMASPGFNLTTSNETETSSGESVDGCYSVVQRFCSHQCLNTPGSFICTCPEGLALSEDGKSCVDVDECSTGANVCNDNCVNLYGKYTCQCGPGYEFDWLNRRCCQKVSCFPRCSNINGNYSCECSAGYVLSSDFTSCLDVDECLTIPAICNQTCSNIPGSYVCSCVTGYYLGVDNTTCLDLDECSTNANNCEQRCTNSLGSFICSCWTGYILGSDYKSCVDVDECSSGIAQCNQTCANIPGSFTCSCGNGYFLGSDRTSCLDIDECSTRVSQCNQTCNNSLGSYTCSCRSGFSLASDGRSCKDLDECSINTHRCNHTCINTIGSYSCSCNTGFFLDLDQRNCLDIDECSSNLHICNQTCNNVPGSYYCTCFPGFYLMMEDQSCVDIDECAAGFHQCNQNCQNIPGSYNCTCGLGYQLAYDKKNCLDIDECATGKHQCAQNCTNIIGNYSCSCTTGFELAVDQTNCVDVDECVTRSHKCFQQCVNTRGSYKCSCNPGFVLASDNFGCLDINECKSSIKYCSQGCKNLYGTFSCFCYRGYALDSDKRTCIDVEECSSGAHGCSQICNNTQGSFHCGCHQGYNLLDDLISCGDIDECATKVCSHNCTNTPGSYRCSCFPGYQQGPKNDSCLDVDECSTSTHNCTQICVNQPGSYTCHCHQGYQLAADQRSCEKVVLPVPLITEAFNTSSTSLLVRWILKPSGSSFPVQIGYMPYTRDTDLLTLPPSMNSKQLKIQGLRPYTIYSVFARLSTNWTDGEWSMPAFVRTDEKAVQTRPENLQASHVDSTSIIITWSSSIPRDPYAIVLGYQVSYGIFNATTKKFSDVTVVDLYSQEDTFAIGELRPNTIYTVKVSYFSRKGVGPYSRAIVVRTTLDNPCNPTSPCLNGGICLLSDAEASPGRRPNYTCLCLANFHGRYCESYLAGKRCKSPTVSIALGQSITQATKVPRSESYTISSTVELDCRESYETEFAWMVTPFSRTDALLKRTGVSELRIPRRRLDYGIYVVALVVRMKDIAVYGRSNGYIEITDSALVAVIEGGTKVTRGNNASVTLDASSSYDPDTGDSVGLRYTWLCRDRTEKLPDYAVSYPLIEVPGLFRSLKASSFKGGCYGTGAGQLKGNGSTLVLDTAKIMPGRSYVLTVIVEKGKRSTRYEQEVDIARGKKLEILIQCIYNCRARNTPSRRLALASKCYSLSCIGLNSFHWRVFYVRNSTKHEIPSLQSSLTTASNRRGFVLKPYSLLEGESVVITLKVSSADGTTGHAQYSFQTNKGPSGGTCAVLPVSGVTLVTKFSFNCSGWFDLDEPLRYEFFYVEKNGKETVLHDGTSSFEAELPMGERERGSLLDVRVRVYDSLGTSTQVNTPVKVIKSKLFAVINAIELTSGKESRLNELLQSGDIRAASRLANNVLKAIKDPTNNTMEEQKQRAKIKSSIVLQMAAIKVQSADAIRDTSDVIAAATTSLDDIDIQAQKSSVEAFKSMASVLTDEAAQDVTYELLVQGAQGLVSSIGNVLRIASHSADISLLSVHNLTDTALNISQETGSNLKKAVEAKRVASELLTVFSRVGQTILSKQVIGEEPINFQGLSATLVLLREEPLMLAGKLLSNENASFQMPRETGVFGGETTYVDSQMLVTEHAVFTWDESASRVSTVVVGIETTDQHGNNITLLDLDTPVELMLPRLHSKGLMGNDTIYTLYSNRTMYHIINTQHSNMSLRVTVRPLNESRSLSIAVQRGTPPIFGRQDYMVTLARNATCSDASQAIPCADRYSFVVGPPLIASAGKYFVGVRLAEEHVGAVNYTMEAQASACIYWDKPRGEWVGDGCQIGPLSTTDLVHCLCSHLTSFSGQLIVLPNPIDFQKVSVEFKRLDETGNVVAFIALGVVFGVYVIVIAWARRQDHKDRMKVGLKPFIGSYCSSTFTYHTWVTTGIWRNAGTTANVFIVLNGEKQSSRPIHLRNPSCIPFARGNTDSFILSITEDLGRIKSVRIWHDNTGENPSWFLNHVIISTGESESRDLVFNFQQWLAVERGAGFVDRTKNVSSEEELSDLKASFGNRVYQELFQSHLWFSVLTRPPSCVFTRVQRVTCCLVLLLTMMLANAMFYELAPQADRNSDTTVKIGPLRLELRQLLIAIESAIIVAPLNFIIVFIFTHIKPRDRPNKSQRHYSVNRRRSLLKLTGPSEKKKCRFLLPYWFTYISYFLCLATVAASGTFIVFYSLMWGRYISTQWLISMVMAVTVDIFVSKPLSLILLVVFLVLLVRRKMDVAEYKDSQTTQGVILDLADVDLDENPDSLAQCAQYNGPCHVMPPKPPTKEQLEKSRRLHRMKQEMFAWVKEVVIFVGYLCILLVVAHGSRSQWMHPIKSSLFQTTADNDNMLTSFDKFWGWSSSVLLPILFEDGKGRVGQGTNEAYFGDGESIIVGTPTLRQIRVNRDHCEVVNIFRPYIHNCTSTLLTSEEETTASFLPGWKPKPINTTLPLILQKEKPWMYTNSELTGGTRFWSYIHARLVYSGGGYAVDLGKTKKEATSILKSLQENSWIDRYTAALFVDFAIYSPSTSLFGIVKIVMEMSPSGSIKLSHVIDIIRLYDVSTGYDVSLLFFQLLLPVLVIYFTMSLVLKLKKGILRFFCTVFNWVDMSQIVCVSAWMSVHIYKMIYIDKSSKDLLAKTHATTGFDYIVMLNTIENVVIALVVFLNTLKLLIYCQFSHVKHFFQVLVKSFYDVGSFLTILFFAIGAFAQFAYIVFGQNLANHRNLLESYNCLLNIMIGADHDFRELTDFDAVIGSAYLMIFSFASMIFFVNFFILILIHYYDIGRKEQFAMYGLGMYIVDRFKEAMGVGKTVIPREPTEFDNIRQQCHLLRYMLKSRAFRQMEYRCEQILSKSVKAPQSPNGKVKTKCSLFKALAPLVHDRTTFDNPMLEERPPDKNSLFSGKLDRRLKTLSTLLNADYIDGFMEDLDVISLAEASAFWRRYHDSIIPASITQVFERPELPPELRSLVTDQISSEYATVSGFGIRKESLDYEPQRCEPDFTDSFTWEGPDTLPKVTFSDDTNGTEPLPASITEIFQNSHKNVQERSTRPIFAPVTEPRSKTPRRQSNALPLTLLRELDDGEEALPDSITDIFKTACKPTSTRTQSLPASEFTTLQQAKVSSWATFGKDAEATRNLPDTGILEDYHSFKKKGLVKTIRLRSTSVGEAQNMPKTTAGQLRPSRRHLKAPSTGKERKAYILPTVQEEFDKMKKEVSERGQRSPRNGNSG